MEEICKDIPEDCWELIVSQLDDHHQWESLSIVCKKLMYITNHMRRSLKVINPSIEVLSKQLQIFPRLQKIDLSDISGSLQEALHVVASSEVDIQELNICGSRNTPIESLSELSSKMNNMRVFSCSKSYLDDNDLVILSDCFPLLEVLDISYQRFQDITDEGIIPLSKKLKRLRKIDLTGNHKISDQSVISLASNCKHLTEMVLRNCYNVSQTGISFAMENCHSFNSLILASNWFHHFELTNTFNLSKLINTIDLHEVSISDDILYKIAKANLPLKNLHLTSCKMFTYNGIYALLNAYQSLESFSLARNNIMTDESLIYICQFIRNLISINLDGCSKLTSSSFIAVSSACPVLKNIDMSLPRNNSSLNCASGSCKNPSIRSASLSGHTLSEVLHICQNLQALKVNHLLDSHELDIADILKYCPDIRNLTVYSADKLKFSGEAGKDEMCKLEYFSAPQSQGMNDQVLEMVGKRCPRLLYLDLEGCRSVTAKGLTEIAKHCRQLRHVNLDWCLAVQKDVIGLMVSSCPLLRKIVSPNPTDHTVQERESFLRQGCLVVPGTWEDDYY